jgi:hypothetical protein
VSVVGFEKSSNVDRVGKLATQEFLSQEIMRWKGLPHPRGVFKADLTDGRKFTWHLYATNTSWHAGKFDGQLGIRAFGYGWQEQGKTGIGTLRGTRADRSGTRPCPTGR